MVSKMEYDFLTWNSAPSSIILTNNEEIMRGWWMIFKNVPVTPGTRVRVEIMAKSDNVPAPYHPGKAKEYGSYLTIWGSNDSVTYQQHLLAIPSISVLPRGVNGKTDWTKYALEMEIPPDMRFIRGQLAAATGLTWFDDLKIYQNGALIYENQFTDWALVGAGVGAILGGVAGEIYKPLGPIVSPLIGALGGAALGGGIGYAVTQPTTVTIVTIRR